MILRDSWEPNALVFAFKSGSSRGHAHPSQNEFQIYYNGKPVTCGAGYATASAENATWAHNCILVDGEGQGQEPGDLWTLPLGTVGEIKQVDISEPYYRYILGDATAPYDGRLDKWLRHVAFVEPANYFVIYDQVAASTAKQFDWLLHCKNYKSETYSLTVEGNWITLEKSGGTIVDSAVKLQTMVVEPEAFAHEILHYFKPYGREYDYIKVRPAEAASSAQFLTVHFPLAESGSALPTERVAVGNVIGAKIVDGNNLDLVLFSTDGNPVNEYIELGGSYEAADGGTYLFESTGVRAQFDSYQVMRLTTSVGRATSGGIIGALLIIIALIIILIILSVILLRRRRFTRA